MYFYPKKFFIFVEELKKGLRDRYLLRYVKIKKMKKLVRKAKVLFRVFLERKKAKKEVTEREVAEASILHLMVSDKTPIEIIAVLETINLQVELILKNKKAEYLKQVKAINQYLD
jgi:hypothetical protein